MLGRKKRGLSRVRLNFKIRFPDIGRQFAMSKPENHYYIWQVLPMRFRINHKEQLSHNSGQTYTDLFFYLFSFKSCKWYKIPGKRHSDKSHFSLSSGVHFLSCQIWGTERPHETWQIPPGTNLILAWGDIREKCIFVLYFSLSTRVISLKPKKEWFRIFPILSMARLQGLVFENLAPSVTMHLLIANNWIESTDAVGSAGVVRLQGFYARPT